MDACTTFPCPVCDTPMLRVTSHEQCPQCGFILPCCDGDALPGGLQDSGVITPEPDVSSTCDSPQTQS